MQCEKQKGLKRLISSTNNSLAGFIDAFLTESAFRQLVIINAVLLIIALSLDITKVERLFLVACSFLLLVVELLNTAIESAVDRISLDWHPLSKRAKDIAGSAQLVTVVMTILIWMIVLF